MMSGCEERSQTLSWHAPLGLMRPILLLFWLVSIMLYQFFKLPDAMELLRKLSFDA
jgi:hypothetical protein